MVQCKMRHVKCYFIYIYRDAFSGNYEIIIFVKNIQVFYINSSYEIYVAKNINCLIPMCRKHCSQ